MSAILFVRFCSFCFVLFCFVFFFWFSKASFDNCIIKQSVDSVVHDSENYQGLGLSASALIILAIMLNLMQ